MNLALNPGKVRTLTILKTNFRESPVSPCGRLGRSLGGRQKDKKEEGRGSGEEGKVF